LLSTARITSREWPFTRTICPNGVDLVFNTNKSNTGNKHDAMKPMKTDKDGNVDQTNPFGASDQAYWWADQEETVTLRR
jgi:hypothetical protein